MSFAGGLAQGIQNGMALARDMEDLKRRREERAASKAADQRLGQVAKINVGDEIPVSGIPMDDYQPKPERGLFDKAASGMKHLFGVDEQKAAAKAGIPTPQVPAVQQLSVSTAAPVQRRAALPAGEVQPVMPQAALPAPPAQGPAPAPAGDEVEAVTIQGAKPAKTRKATRADIIEAQARALATVPGMGAKAAELKLAADTERTKDIGRTLLTSAAMGPAALRDLYNDAFKDGQVLDFEQDEKTGKLQWMMNGKPFGKPGMEPSQLASMVVAGINNDPQGFMAAVTKYADMERLDKASQLAERKQKWDEYADKARIGIAQKQVAIEGSRAAAANALAGAQTDALRFKTQLDKEEYEAVSAIPTLLDAGDPLLVSNPAEYFKYGDAVNLRFGGKFSKSVKNGDTTMVVNGLTEAFKSDYADTLARFQADPAQRQGVLGIGTAGGRKLYRLRTPDGKDLAFQDFDEAQQAARSMYPALYRNRR